MNTLENKIAQEIREEIEKISPSLKSLDVGKVMKVSDGVANISGLSGVGVGETLKFPGGILGIALNLKKDDVGAIILGEYSLLKEGDEVTSIGQIFSINVSDSYLGRVLNPLTEAIDPLGKIKHSKGVRLMPVERIAPGIIEREPVNTPLSTGIKTIDAITPIGRGQRELIIGDRNTGKTALAIDTIINQSKENQKRKNKVISIYVAIGQKQAKVAQVVEKLEKMNAMEHTIVISASASDAVALQYIAPYVGATIAEYFMEKGQDVLIVYDDLTKHAWAYRQISLILRRPSGREAYPGDVFYLHSKLLERACKMSQKNGGGSITALPIIETQAQDISAFIPTNVISITDGQIYLEPDLFYQGIRPAINIGLSVSRVGGAAQLKAVKQVAGRLRLDLAQYNELSAFAQFGSEMDALSKSKIDRGERIIELLKQPQYSPVAVAEEVLVLWLVTRGHLDSIPVPDCQDKSSQFAKFVLAQYKEFSKLIETKEGITSEIEKKLENFAIRYLK